MKGKKLWISGKLRDLDDPQALATEINREMKAASGIDIKFLCCWNEGAGGLELWWDLPLPRSCRWDQIMHIPMVYADLIMKPYAESLKGYDISSPQNNWMVTLDDFEDAYRKINKDNGGSDFQGMNYVYSGGFCPCVYF
ncbi:MAG: hypothetical protein HUK20_13585 [Fibrobacter sp.]|nr:hypothetical protein [Fibrobacter sp.]